MIVRRFALATLLTAGALVVAGCGMMNKLTPASCRSALRPEQVPPNASSGSGTGKSRARGNILKWTIAYSGMTGPVTAGHFHGPALPARTPASSCRSPARSPARSSARRR